MEPDGVVIDEVNEREEAYKKLLEFMTFASSEHFRAVAMETAKSNPTFFIKALEKNGYSFDDAVIKNKAPLSDSKNPVNLFHPEYGTVAIMLKDILPIAYHIKETKKVNAIKAFREVTGFGLKQAKTYCDSFEDWLVNVGLYHIKNSNQELIHEIQKLSFTINLR